MANNYFNFKQFTIIQERSAFRVSTDSVLLGACAEIRGVTTVLDIGTGTGVIALMIAQRCNAEITAIEPDRDSFDEACINVGNSKWSNRIKVLNLGLQDYMDETGNYDLIVSNPPYFTGSLKNRDARSAAARHNDSLMPAELLRGVTRHLGPGGRFQIILPYAEGTVLIAHAQKFGLYCNNIIKIRPTPRSAVKRLVLAFSRTNSTPAGKFLTLEKGQRHEYTAEYMNLTKDFYINF
ncbi:MAG: methyltransferase [Bacteroidales bacterium]|jgi:tRNA1Val (adenine37-N6)-methyltransferase|nr:methyltransferase [Bacteroidales bacterium]